MSTRAAASSWGTRWVLCHCVWGALLLGSGPILRGAGKGWEAHASLDGGSPGAHHVGHLRWQEGGGHRYDGAKQGAQGGIKDGGDREA